VKLLTVDWAMQTVTDILVGEQSPSLLLQQERSLTSTLGSRSQSVVDSQTHMC